MGAVSDAVIADLRSRRAIRWCGCGYRIEGRYSLERPDSGSIIHCMFLHRQQEHLSPQYPWDDEEAFTHETRKWWGMLGVYEMRICTVDWTCGESE
jgi:hypothetical protein